MTRSEIAVLWAEGKLTDEEVRQEMKKTKHSVLRDYDPLNEIDSWWDGEEENTSMSVGLDLLRLYGKEQCEKFFNKFWPKQNIIKYDPRGNLVE